MVHGFQVSQWGSHDNVHQPRTSPLALLQEIGSALGLSPLADCEKYNDSPRGLRKLRQAILDGARAHGELFRWLMRHRRWDVFCAVFAAPHCVGHRFWRFMDPSWPDYRDGELADTIESAYRAVDSEIDRMLAVAGDQTRVLAVAAHGMGPLYHASWNLDQILDLLGFNGERRSRGKSVGNVNPWRILKMTIPSRLQYLIKESLPRALQDYLVFRWYAAGRKYAGRRVFAVPNNDNAGAIRISVAGRDRKGLVDPAEEYRRLRDEIAKALRELTDPITGRPVVEEVISLHEKYAGPHVSGLPDLAVRWNHSFPWRAVHSPRFGTLPVPCQDLRSGSHGPRGFLIAAGPGIPAGAELEGCSIYDIAPTILQAAGVPVPETMDGRPLTALCRQLSAAIAR
jgi:predicted AlkP superfamily phosphohydrolase/phosphomutase